MTRAYSQDLRDRLIDAVEREGMSRRATAVRFSVSKATAIRWVQAYRSGRRSALGSRLKASSRRSSLVNR
jgi:transposase